MARAGWLLLFLVACGGTETWSCDCVMVCGGDSLGSIPADICSADDPAQDQGDTCTENLVIGQNECPDDSSTSCTCTCSPTGESC